MDLFMNRQQKTTSMRKFALRAMLLLSSLFIVLGISSMVMLRIALSGDSIKLKQQQREALRTLTMPPSTQIR